MARSATGQIFWLVVGSCVGRGSLPPSPKPGLISSSQGRECIGASRGGATQRACVIGSGPNGLAAAIVLARAGLQVDVYEAQVEPGGAARTLPLTLPGFLHDFGSGVHPLAAASPFFSSLPLEQFGLEWVHGEAPLAHPLDDGSAVLLARDLAHARRELGSDGKSWTSLMLPITEHWDEFIQEVLAPPLHIPHHPLRMARFVLNAMEPARMLAHGKLATQRARALFAGIAGHSLMSFDQPLSSAIPLVLGAAAHAVGWPVPRSGARAISHALIGYLESLGGALHTSHHVDAENFRELETQSEVMMCDLTPRQLIAIAGDRLSVDDRIALAEFRLGAGVFKLDYALSEPVPWRAPACRLAITLHLGGTFEEIAAAEHEVLHGRDPERPFVLAAQPTLFDGARAPRGKHVLWAYCHVPNGSPADMTERLERQIERFAPGFRDCVLARHISTPETLEAMDANLIGGDISGGAINLRQYILRPTRRAYATSNPKIFLCSSSTPPGPAVHGMCGYHAAQLALRRLN